MRNKRQRNDEDNLRVLFERVLHPSAMPAERARLVWERFVQLELCLSRTGGSLVKAQNVEDRMNQVVCAHTPLLYTSCRRCVASVDLAGVVGDWLVVLLLLGLTKARNVEDRVKQAW